MSRLGLTNNDSAGFLSKLMPQMTKEDFNDGSKRRELYLNPAQLLAYNFGARSTFVRAGRGLGKSTGFLAPRLINCARSIPRSEGLFLGNSIKQLYTKTLPQVITGMEEVFGLKEGFHFCRGRAPKKLNYKMPVKVPRVWENVIHWFNGSCTYAISMEIKASANGFNAAYIISDETRYLPWKKVQEEVLPTLRGGAYDHPGWDEQINPYYLSQMWVSDAAITLKQAEWEKSMNDQTDDINEQIAEMLAEVQVLPELATNEYYLKKLNRLRGESRVFFNFSSLENAAILGERYFRELKRDMPAMMFDIQILGKKKGVAKDGYYANFDSDLHGYIPSEDDQTNAVYNKFTKKFVSTNYVGGVRQKVEWEAPDLDETSRIKDCTLDTDVMASEPLRIAFDYNANISTVVTGQTYKVGGLECLNVLSSMFVKNERKLRALCGDWCRYYEPQRRRNNNVIFYYDSTAKQGGSYAVENADATRFNTVVKEELTRRGWKVTEVYMGNPMGHQQKFTYINDVLTGKQNPFLRMNKENNEYLIVAMENCRVKMTGRGPMKDKSQEKLKSEEGEGGALETRTDITDALDTLLIGVRFHSSSGYFFSLPQIR